MALPSFPRPLCHSSALSAPREPQLPARQCSPGWSHQMQSAPVLVCQTCEWGCHETGQRAGTLEEKCENEHRPGEWTSHQHSHPLPIRPCSLLHLLITNDKRPRLGWETQGANSLTCTLGTKPSLCSTPHVQSCQWLTRRPPPSSARVSVIGGQHHRVQQVIQVSSLVHIQETHFIVLHPKITPQGSQASLSSFHLTNGKFHCTFERPYYWRLPNNQNVNSGNSRAIDGYSPTYSTLTLGNARLQGIRQPHKIHNHSRVIKSYDKEPPIPPSTYWRSWKGLQQGGGPEDTRIPLRATLDIDKHTYFLPS